MYNDPLGDAAAQAVNDVVRQLSSYTYGGYWNSSEPNTYAIFADDETAMLFGGAYMSTFDLWGNAQFDSQNGPGAARSLDDAFYRFDSGGFSGPGNGATSFKIQVGRNEKGAEIYTGITITGKKTNSLLIRRGLIGSPLQAAI